MSIDIAKKGPLLESFYLKLEEDGWNFKECRSRYLAPLGRFLADLGNTTLAGPNEKDRALLVDFQVVIAEFKRLDPRWVASAPPND